MQISTALTRRPYGRIMTHVLNFGGDISWKVITWKTGKDMLETLFGHE